MEALEDVWIVGVENRDSLPLKAFSACIGSKATDSSG